MNNGKMWVLGMLALGACAGLFAATYWKRPENSVRWSFTQIHTSIVRGRKDAAARFLAPRVTWNGRELAAAGFLDAYALPPDPDVIDTLPCPSLPSHWTVTMRNEVYCFVEDGPLWRLHEVTSGRCRCKP
jgi:hypothetical protein